MIKMKLNRWLENLGTGYCEIICEEPDCRRCQKPFGYNVKEPHNKGMVVCPECGAKCNIKDVAGIYFLIVEYPGKTGGKNWKCGRCGCEFLYHKGETESVAKCPNCHAKKGEI